MYYEDKWTIDVIKKPESFTWLKQITYLKKKHGKAWGAKNILSSWFSIECLMIASVSEAIKMAEQRSTGSYICPVIEQGSQHVDWDKERERKWEIERSLEASFNNIQKQRVRDIWYYDRMNQLPRGNFLFSIFPF